MEQSSFIKINPADSVVVCLRPMKKGEVIEVDGKTITLKLRDDIKWHDGEPITSKDFDFTYKMYMADKNAVASRTCSGRKASTSRRDTVSAPITRSCAMSGTMICDRM